MIDNDLYELLSSYDFGDSRIYLAPNIPTTKLAKALSAYANTVSQNDVILLYDDTLFRWRKRWNNICERRSFFCIRA